MSKIISIVNQKGGVGKTTTTINLATALVSVGQKILVIDLDPQGNTSTGFGVPLSDRKITIYDVLTNDVAIADAIFNSEIGNLDLIAADTHLAAAEVELFNFGEGGNRVLKEKLDTIKDQYDFIFIDCPPSLGMLTINAMVASDKIMIPLQCEFFALEGLSHLLKTFDAIKADLNRSLAIEGIVLTMYDKRNKLTEQIETEIRKFMGNLVYKSVIVRNVKVAEAPSHGKPVIAYDLKCSGSECYISLAREIIEQNGIVIS